MIGFIDEYNATIYSVDTPIIIGISIGIALIIAAYLLRSFGLYTMAKREGKKFTFLAFIPFVWTYTACDLAGEVSFFGRKIKFFPAIFIPLYCFVTLTVFVFNFLTYFPIVGYYFAGGNIYLSTQAGINAAGLSATTKTFWTGSGVYVGTDMTYPYADPDAIAKLINAFNVIDNILEIALTLLSVLMYINIFRSYWPMHYVAGTILSVFGLFPLMVFIVRNNRKFDFEAYIKQRYASFYANNPYNNPYNGANGTGAGGGAGTTGGGDPFSDFGASNGGEGKSDGGTGADNGGAGTGGDDPFSDFDK